MPENDDGEDDGIDAIADALDQAKRAGEFAHWRGSEMNPLRLEAKFRILFMKRRIQKAFTA